MANLTISTDGVKHLIGSEPTECHQVAEIEYVRHWGDRMAQTVMLTLTPGEAFALAADLLYQAVDAGLLSGWNVQFPERADS